MAYIGFELWDFSVIAFCMKSNKKLHFEQIVHHIANIIANLTAFISGFAAPANSMLGTGIDFTSIFLNVKELIPASHKNGTLDVLNKLTFFFTFTLIRIIGIPFMCARTVFDLRASWE